MNLFTGAVHLQYELLAIGNSSDPGESQIRVGQDMGHAQCSTAPQVFLYHRGQTHMQRPSNRTQQHWQRTSVHPALTSGVMKLDHCPFCLRSCCILNRTSLVPPSTNSQKFDSDTHFRICSSYMILKCIPNQPTFHNISLRNDSITHFVGPTPNKRLEIFTQTKTCLSFPNPFSFFHVHLVLSVFLFPMPSPPKGDWNSSSRLCIAVCASRCNE